MQMTTGTRSLVAAAIVVLSAVGCSALDGSRPPSSTTRETVPGSVPGSSSGSTAAAGTTVRPGTTAKRIVCNGVGEINQDDPEPGVGVIERTDLPVGRWTPADVPPCPWALSADELLAAPACRAAAVAAGKAPNDESRNGAAHLTFTREDGNVQVDEHVEIYTSSQNVHAIRAILPGPQLAPCVEQALTQSLPTHPGTTIGDIVVTAATLPESPADLGLGFPAVEGYAADAGFVAGVDVSFVATAGGARTPVALRSIAFGGGGAMATLTLIGPDLTTLRSIDITPTLRAATSNFQKMFDPNR